MCDAGNDVDHSLTVDSCAFAGFSRYSAQTVSLMLRMIPVTPRDVPAD
jgi:hypothetical protein